MEKVISQQSSKKNVCFSAYSRLEKGTFLTSVYFVFKNQWIILLFSFGFIHTKTKFYTNYANYNQAFKTPLP